MSAETAAKRQALRDEAAERLTANGIDFTIHPSGRLFTIPNGASHISYFPAADHWVNHANCKHGSGFYNLLDELGISRPNARPCAKNS